MRCGGFVSKPVSPRNVCLDCSMPRGQCALVVRSVVINTIGTVMILFLLFPVSAVPQGKETSETNANDLAHRVLMNEVNAEAQDHSHWMFRLETEKSGGKEVDEVVETKNGDLRRPLSINGQPLTAKQERAADVRIERLVRDSNALRKSMREENEDAARSQRLLKMLPNALSFSFGEQHGDTVELKFKPNPRFRPASREQRVFQAMEGEMWINRKHARLLEITAHLTHEVKFGGGFLGHLDRGGQFEVKQTEVAPGYWELTDLDVDMKGRALFFKTISVRQKLRRSDFHQVSDDLSLAQAADLLRKQAL
jgi:hypothetical protein